MRTVACRSFLSNIERAGASVGVRTVHTHHISASNFASNEEHFSFPVVNSEGEVVKQIDLRQNVFGRHPIRADLIHRVVVWQRARRRQGSAKNKNRAEVSGTGKKPYPQKGRGAARHGSLRSPQFRGGGRAFAKQPRDFDYALPKAIRKLGLQHALSTKMGQGKLVVVSPFELEQAKTRLLEKILSANKWNQSLYVTKRRKTEAEDNLRLASANLRNFHLVPEKGLNVYDIMLNDYLLISEDTIDDIHKRF